MQKQEGQVMEANHRNLDEQNSEEKERERGEKDKHRGKTRALVGAITYLNAVPVISCCPLFDNNLRPLATTRFLAEHVCDQRKLKQNARASA